jgi:hypothetical protein
MWPTGESTGRLGFLGNGGLDKLDERYRPNGTGQALIRRGKTDAN